MTPQERQMIDELFDRLARLESAPRDPDAAAAIAQGLRKAPNAAYPLVQTVLLQDEALKRAKLLSCYVPEELGGMGLSIADLSTHRSVGGKHRCRPGSTSCAGSSSKSAPGAPNALPSSTGWHGRGSS